MNKYSPYPEGSFFTSVYCMDQRRAPGLDERLFVTLRDQETGEKIAQSIAIEYDIGDVPVFKLVALGRQMWPPDWIRLAVTSQVETIRCLYGPWVNVFICMDRNLPVFRAAIQARGWKLKEPAFELVMAMEEDGWIYRPSATFAFAPKG